MIGLCVAAGAALATLAVSEFTLAWTHSVEKIEWQEDWRIAPEGLVLVESRVQGHGAGMAPEAGAAFDGRWWRSRPGRPPQPDLLLARSGAVEDWRLCVGGECRALGALVPASAERLPVRLAPCATEPGLKPGVPP